MLDEKFVKEIASMAEVKEFSLSADLSLDGREHHFTSKPIFEVIPTAPEIPDPVEVKTLAGFGDLVVAGLEGLDRKKFFIHVVDYDEVVLEAKESDKWGRRIRLIKASPVEFRAFPFGQLLDQETFIIGVASGFVQTDDKDYVLKIASSLTNEATSISEDNGFAQKATIKSGMKMPENITLKPVVELAPFRTFPEVAQVQSQFIFRAKVTERGSHLQLVEADGGRWKIAAIAEVARFVRQLGLTDLDIIS